MDFDQLKASIGKDEPPDGLSGPLLALWHARKGNWDRAHEIVQDDDGKVAAWVHAHLHRVEGDESNANYWYRRAGKDNPGNDLGEEWEVMTLSLISGDV